MRMTARFPGLIHALRKKEGVKLFVWALTSFLSEMILACKGFAHGNKSTPIIQKKIFVSNHNSESTNVVTYIIVCSYYPTTN